MKFPETQWTLLAQATLSGDADGREALRSLCERYERPILAFIRARVGNPDLARDLSQSFWLFLFERRTWRLADINRGKFRTFLIGVLTNFLNDDLRQRNALRRGGRAEHVEIGEFELADGADTRATAAYDREWAVCVLQRALEDLEAWYLKQNRSGDYVVLRTYLPGVQKPPPADEGAAALGVTVEVFRVEIHRARQRLLNYLRQQVAQTVTPAEVEEEMAYLGRSLG